MGACAVKGMAPSRLHAASNRIQALQIQTTCYMAGERVASGHERELYSIYSRKHLNYFHCLSTSLRSAFWCPCLEKEPYHQINPCSRTPHPSAQPLTSHSHSEPESRKTLKSTPRKSWWPLRADFFGKQSLQMSGRPGDGEQTRSEH